MSIMQMMLGSGAVIKDGSSAALAGDSALAIKTATGTNTDGVYWINLPTVGPTQIYCIMDSNWDGGGWMMAMKAANTGTTFNYNANYWTTDNTLNPTDTTQNAGDAKFDSMNKFAAKDLMARWPDITSSGGGIAGRGVWTWLRNNFYLSGTRITPISFFSTAGQVTVASGVANVKANADWGSGVFSSQSGAGFYGFNFTSYASAPVRWGFAWNNETNFASNDVSGGIGMNAVNIGGQAATRAYSAGDYIGCCQDTTGINRSARVEIYIR
jgi:hypothetical protein